VHTLQADTEAAYQCLAQKERMRLPLLDNMDDNEMVTTIRLYTLQAVDKAVKGGYFESLRKHPTDGNWACTAESYIAKLYDRNIGNLLWHIVSFGGAIHILVHN
jgi:hypothetical protein